MSSYPNLTLDFSDVPPSQNMLSAIKKKREVAKPITDWRRIKILDLTLGYACSPRCAAMAIAIFGVGQEEGDGDPYPYAVSLAGDKGVAKADYNDVRCCMGCKWRVV